MKTIRVQTKQPYDVLVGRDIHPLLGEQAAKRLDRRAKKALVVCDSRTGRPYGGPIREALRRQGLDAALLALPAGGERRSVEALNRLLEAMAGHKLGSGDLAVALGGAGVMELTGFACGLYRGGIPYIQVPTTLAAAVDASVAVGWTLHLTGGRELLRVERPPALVLCDTKPLDALEGGSFSDGLAGAAALACVADAELFRLLETASPRQATGEIIARAVEQKSRILTEPELWELLEFGLTMGRGVERLSGYQLSRGKTRAVGICLVAEACVKNRLMGAVEADRIRALLARLGLPTGCRYPLADICRESLAVLEGDSIPLVTLERIGKGAVYPLSPSRFADFFLA